MAAAAKAHGYEYMAITDHSYSLAMVGGLTPDRLRAQMAEIRAIGDSLGIRIFAGSEVDIKADGTLDFDDDLLAELDFVIASSHLHNNQTREAQTKRMVKVIENPHVDLIAHPTGRLILRRDPYAVDVEALIEAAARTGTALEINAAPERLDLKDEYARQAAQAGVKIAINTDAHRTVEYDLMHYGITTAQRAWLTPADVLNTMTLAEFEAWLKR
jgi:DNA polymerase (family 10)